MSPFRRFSRRFWPLHAYLMVSMILWPVPSARSYWTDSNEDGVKEWVDEAGLDPAWWDADSDSDGLTNAQEALYGSDPYAKDSDRDGLSDLVERDYTPPSAPFDPWSWDTDGDGYSDHDEYYFMIQGSPLVVHYPSLSGPFYDYRDADGDGLLNYEDSNPTGMDRDGDGLMNWQDSYMDDANNGAGTGYTPPPMDSDFDGIPDESDPFPWGSYWYGGIEYGGMWMDRDSDGIPDAADAYPDGSYWYAGVEYPGLWSDMDWDGIPDPVDPFPYSSTTYWFNGVEYPGSWQDSDWDGIPDPADGWPNDRWNGQPYFTYNGSEYPGAWEDRDGDGVPDATDSWPDDPENGADDDNDGLSNYDERTQHFTDPAQVDTDHDWLTDYEELYVFHTNPKAPRSGLASGQSLLDGQIHLGADADGDELPDVLEDYYASLGYGLNKNDPADGAGDLDSDGYTNAQAFTFGWSLIANRGTYDQDGDGMDDAVEDYWAALYPGSMDKTVFEDAVGDHDQDGLMNYEEVVRHNLNGWLLPADPGDPWSFMRTLGYEVVQGTTPNDGQLMRWWWDVSRADYGGVDNGNPVPADATLLDVEDVAPAPNGLPDGYERWLAVVGPETNTARAILADEDGDGIPNVWEHRHRFDPRDDTDAVSPFGGVTVPPLVMPNANDPVFYTDDGSGPQFVQLWYDSAMAEYEADLPAHNQLLAQIGKMDPDGDHLANLDEYLHGTNPRIADSDHDGFEDGAELQNGSDPLLAASVPPVVLSLVSGGGQSITVGLAATKLLVVKASQGGIPRVGSPVTFASTDQRLSLNNGATTLTLLADEAGTATIAIAGASGAAVGAASVQVTAPAVVAALSVPFTLTPGTGGGGGSGGPTGPVPTPFSTPPPQYHLFTAKRERSVKYSGTEIPSHPTNSREIGGSTEWFKQAETTPPPDFSDDGFNGDADLQGDNEDPGDPRDDLGSTAKYSEVPATEGETGAYSRTNPVTATTNVGPFSGGKTTHGTYTAQNAYPNPGPDDLKQKHASTFYTYGEAVTRLGDVAYQRGDDSNGWQGNGLLGIKSYQVMSTHTINSSTLTIEYFDEESGEVLEDSAVVRSCSGRVEQAEVRLQTNTPVDAAHPARMTYSLFKRAISSSGDTYTNQATIELSISSGQISDTATVLSGTLPAEVQAQSGLITMTSPAVSEGEMAAWVLLPVDLDIVHPATGELDEGKQHDQTQGGLVAVKRGDFTKPVRDEPVTELVIRANTAIQGLKWKLKFNGGTNFKLWKDLARTQAVVSEQTEFDPAQDVKLYFEGLKKSGSVGEHNVKLMAVINGSSVEADTVYFTVVEAQVLVQVRYWIREGWIDIPWHPLVNPVPNYAIAGGDRRDNSLEWEPGKGTPPLTTAPGYRVAQEIVIQPFKELNPTGLTPGSRTGSAENRSGITSLFHKPSSVPLWALPWAPGVNELLPTATPTGAVPPPTDRMHIESSRDGDRKGKVRFHGAASDPLVPGAFDIDWDLNIIIDAADPLQLKYEIEGFHDDYPAVEVNMKFDAKDPSPTTTPFTTSPQPYFWLHPLPSDPFALGNGAQIDISPAKKGDVK